MGPKNIIFITTDQQQFEAKSSREKKYYTPNLDNLAEMGIEFTQHNVTSAQCTPSRATWMTGRYPHEVGVNKIGHKLNPNDDNIATAFNKEEYETVYFGKWHLGGHPSDYGFKVTQYRTAGVELNGVNNQTDYHSYKDAHTTAQAVNYLDDHEGEQPFFMHVSWYMPHPNNPSALPFEDVEAFKDKYEEASMTVPESFYKDDLSTKPEHQLKRTQTAEMASYSEKVIRNDAYKYSKLISLADRNLGKILEKLKDKKMEENTMIVFTSDHGDMQGAHRLRLKGVLPYKELYHVPLMVYIPWESTKRREIADLTSSASVPATMLEAVGAAVPKNFSSSLLPLLKKAEKDDESYVFIEHYQAYWGYHPFRGIITEQYKYVYYYEENVEEMYDLQNDLDENVNIANEQSYQEKKQMLKKIVDDWWIETGGTERQPILDEKSPWTTSTLVNKRPISK